MLGLTWPISASRSPSYAPTILSGGLSTQLSRSGKSEGSTPQKYGSSIYIAEISWASSSEQITSKIFGVRYRPSSPLIAAVFKSADTANSRFVGSSSWFHTSSPPLCCGFKSTSSSMKEARMIGVRVEGSCNWSWNISNCVDKTFLLLFRCQSLRMFLTISVYFCLSWWFSSRYGRISWIVSTCCCSLVISLTAVRASARIAQRFSLLS